MLVIHGIKKRSAINFVRQAAKSGTRKINRQIHYLSPSSDSVFLIMRFMWESWEKTSFKFAALDLPIPRFCQLLTGTGLQKSVNTAGKDALRLVKMQSLNVICWKLTKIWLRKVAEFYRCLYGERKLVNPTTQRSVKFRDFVQHSLDVDVSLLNLTGFLILRLSFQQCQWIFSETHKGLNQPLMGLWYSLTGLNQNLKKKLWVYCFQAQTQKNSNGRQIFVSVVRRVTLQARMFAGRCWGCYVSFV